MNPGIGPLKGNHHLDVFFLGSFHNSPSLHLSQQEKHGHRRRASLADPIGFDLWEGPRAMALSIH